MVAHETEETKSPSSAPRIAGRPDLRGSKNRIACRHLSMVFSSTNLRLSSQWTRPYLSYRDGGAPLPVAVSSPGARLTFPDVLIWAGSFSSTWCLPSPWPIRSAAPMASTRTHSRDAYAEL
ncbi:hypothetical protein V2G26_013285 [Clonostachys chloroleuca]